MQPKINIALRAARRGSRMVANFIDELDYVSKGQISSEEFIANTRDQVETEIFIDIKNAFEDHAFETEHANIGTKEKDTPHKWYISAIDSEINFKRAIPHFTISIVHTYEGIVEHAVLINPITGIEFTASKGHGAYQNAKRIRGSENKHLNGSLVTFYCQNDLPKMLTAVAPLSIHPVIDYSPTLNAAYTAAGKYDATVLQDLSTYDKRPIILLLKEAGCLVCDLDGSANLTSSNLIAAPARLLKPLLKAIN